MHRTGLTAIAQSREIELRTRKSGRLSGQFQTSHKETMMRLLHTMIRVNDLDETLKFYCDGLGMRLLRKRDFPSGEFTLAFIGYNEERDGAVIELTHNWGKSGYDQGTAFGHLAISVDDI